MAHAHDEHEEGHEHEDLTYLTTEVTDGTLAQIRATHPVLADCLDATRRWGQLSDDEKQAAPALQEAVEKVDAEWMPGFHADGDRCASCGLPTLALFSDRFQEGEVPYAAFKHGLPVHATRDCLDAFAAKRKDLSPRGIDKSRRETMRDLDRPVPKMTQFFRHDVLAHPPFGLEDWAESVAAANPDGFRKATLRDIEKVARWVHQKLFHHH